MAFPGITNQVSDKTWGQADHKEGAGRTQKRKDLKTWERIGTNLQRK